MTDLISTQPPSMPNQGATPVSNTVRKSYTSARGEKLDEVFEVEIDGEVFVTYPHRIPGTRLIDFQGIQVTRDPDAMWGFFRHAMPDKATLDDGTVGTVYDRFREFCESPDHIIEADTLGEIIKDMAEFISGRPTEQSSS